MSSSTIRKAIGVVKDHTSISLAKVAGNIAPDLEVLVVKATSHNVDSADEKYFREIINLTSYSRGYVIACVATVSRRLRKTHDWIVALKALMLVHRLLIDGHPWFEEEVVFSARRGIRVLNILDFRDEAHSNSWDHAGFVRLYAMYLEEKVELEPSEKKFSGDERKFNDGREYRDDFGYGVSRRNEEQRKEAATSLREMKTERVLAKLHLLLRILDRVLACKPAGMARNSRLVLVAFYPVVKESFGIYSEIQEALRVLLERYTEMEYTDCVKCFDIYVSAAKMIDELVDFHGWCKDVGIARSSEIPEVERINTVLGTLEGFLKERSDRPRRNPDEISSQEKIPAKEKLEPNMNELRALTPPENYTTAPAEPQPKRQAPRVTQDLANLKDDVDSADERGNKLALTLFSGTRRKVTKTNGAWEAFPSKGEPEVTSAWQTPAAEIGKADWELALVETASNLSKQTATLGGGFDPLLLNGMYAVRQHVSTTQLSDGSASSVALPGAGKCATPVLALPAPDGTLQPVRNQDPFAASLAVPPPSYVQIADMERKQQLLVQEQQLWQQYGRDGMQGQLALAKIGGASVCYSHTPPNIMILDGMPPVVGLGHPARY